MPTPAHNKNTGNQQSDQSNESDLLKFVHNQLQICFKASKKNLTSRTNFYKPHSWGMRRKHSNSQFQMANHRDWGIIGYNDVIVCVTVIKSDERVLFHWTGSISPDKSDRSDCWLWTQPPLTLLAPPATTVDTHAWRHSWLKSTMCPQHRCGPKSTDILRASEIDHILHANGLMETMHCSVQSNMSMHHYECVALCFVNILR